MTTIRTAPSSDAAFDDAGFTSALTQALGSARSHGRFSDRPVPDALLHTLYDWTRWGPTSMNCQPLRVCFVASADARAQLADCVYDSNRAKILSAPVCAVLGMDLDFAAQLPRLFPHKTDAQAYYADKPALVQATALRNSSLQAGYFIVAARLLGLDCGPMSGFDRGRVDALCWAGSSVETNLLCNLGHGDPHALRERAPRLAFDEACRIV
jgi:3-hydroxypropanoate dehydrogenase